MKKLSITIISVISLFCIVACSSEDNKAIQNTETTIINEETEQGTIEKSLQISEEGLTDDAEKKIEEIGGTIKNSVIVTYRDYSDRIIYNYYIMINENKAEFYTYVFYYTEDAYLNELNKEDHYGKIIESNDSARYIYNYIETIENTSYEQLYEEKKDFGVLVE